MKVTIDNRHEVINKLATNLFEKGKFTNPQQFNALVLGFQFYTNEKLQEEVDNVFGEDL